ncbi:putative F-box protein At1g67623 [Lotus japonicus]|uniref:putative F-box protein At1g67623 n=1 Tax=Lotus japonicus TaxID=34305 RepID=UPI0025874372|nr:putative F-box protein At1g67623 [Lotus japonicus]
MVRTRGGGSANFAPRVPLTSSGGGAHAFVHVEKPSLKWTRSKRRRTRKSSYSTAAIKTLPKDLLVEVVAVVASHSFKDFHNVKMCCKDFLDATEDNSVWKRVSLDTFPLIQWLPNDNVSSFLNRCRECGNIESLYREGLRKYFYDPNEKIHGLDILKVTAQKGHKEAKYVCGMILLCSKDDELRKKGLEYMRFLRMFKCVVGSRNKVKQLLKIMWKKNGMVGRNQSPLCNSKSTCKGWRMKKGRWALIDDDDDGNESLNSGVGGVSMASMVTCKGGRLFPLV